MHQLLIHLSCRKFLITQTMLMKLMVLNKTMRLITLSKAMKLTVLKKAWLAIKMCQ